MGRYGRVIVSDNDNDDDIDLIIAGTTGEEHDPLLVDWLFDTPTLVLRGPWRAEFADILAAMQRPALSVNTSLGFSGGLDFLTVVPPLRALHLVKGSSPESALRIPEGVGSQIEELDINADIAPDQEVYPWPSLVKLTARYSPGLQSILRGATNLRILDLVEGIPDSRIFARLCDLISPSITQLKIGSSPLRDMRGIEKCVGRPTELDVVGCSRLKSLSPVSHMPAAGRISRMRISGCRNLSDIDEIGDLIGLEELQLNDCRSISSIQAVPLAPRLRTLRISGQSDIVDGDLEPVLRSTSLREVAIENYKPHYSPGLEQLRHAAGPELDLTIG